MPGRPSLSDCLSRGLASLRANWELVVVHWLKSLAVAALVAAGLLPPLLVVGVGALRALPSSAADVGPWLERAFANLRGLGAALALAAMGTLLVWVLALLVDSFLTAGVMGVLHNADRQAPPGPGRDRRWFRTFTAGDLFGWGGRFVWRYFWFGILAAAFAISLLGLLAAAWFLLGAWGAARWGAGAAIGVGCGGLLPFGFAAVALALWSALALADLAREGSGVWTAWCQAVAVLGRRLGTVLLMTLLFVGIGLAAGLITLPAGLLLRLAFRDHLLASLAVRGVLGLVEGLLASALWVALFASLVALMRGERAALGAA